MYDKDDDDVLVKIWEVDDDGEDKAMKLPAQIASAKGPKKVPFHSLFDLSEGPTSHLPPWRSSPMRIYLTPTVILCARKILHSKKDHIVTLATKTVACYPLSP